MISEKKLMDIVAKLLVKAKAGEVRWQHDPQYDVDDQKTFSVQFKESKLYIQYYSPSTEPDQIEVGIENNAGDTLKRVVAWESDDDVPSWILFSKLYEEAERTVMGSDRVLSEIERELEKEGAIGLS